MNEGFVDVASYMSLPRDKETFIIKPLLPVSGSAVLYSPPKVGKSFLGVQICHAISNNLDNVLGFPVMRHGQCLYLQLDTPRSLWAYDFNQILESGVEFAPNSLMLADRETLEEGIYPFDILQPKHVLYFRNLILRFDPILVVIDTLREAHSGDEDSSTIMRNVVSNLVGCCHPAACLFISHGRKNQPDQEKSLVDDLRGSSFVTGRMDCNLRLTKTKLYYNGRAVEDGDIKITRLPSGFWETKEDDFTPLVVKVLLDDTLKSINAKGKALALISGKGEEACRSAIRRYDLRKLPKKSDVPPSNL